MTKQHPAAATAVPIRLMKFFCETFVAFSEQEIKYPPIRKKMIAHINIAKKI